MTGTAKGSWHSHPGLPKIQFLRPDVAIVDGDRSMSGLHDKELPAETSRYTAVMVKQSGRWKVTAFRSWPQLRSKIDAANNSLIFGTPLSTLTTNGGRR
ncbi:MAG: hypothetical protein DMG30_10820 [Acidobacteria bacterium]|nr:MAG: hypothetical protein DMG30_10820 [Acidobacteriota bacterium]